jgi:predicted alpha/beta superfamily hydrolase
MATLFTKNGQAAWFHDEGDSSGFFHTYDALVLDGSRPEPRKLHVFLPRDYEESDRRYRVLYMNDGHAVFFPGGHYRQSWDMAEVLATLYHRDGLPPVIVVAVCPLDRNDEYTHAYWNDASEYSLLPEYADYLVDSLKPFIDGCYRTQPGQAMIVGSSHGGLAAFYAALRRPGTFEWVAALSPSFWVGLDDATEFPYVRARPEHSLEGSALLVALDGGLRDSLRPSVYLDWGLVRNGGPHNSHIEELATQRGREMAVLLEEQYGYRLGKTLFVVEVPDGGHTEPSWKIRIGEALILWSHF